MTGIFLFTAGMVAIITLVVCLALIGLSLFDGSRK
jgi:hypothetical protein